MIHCCCIEPSVNLRPADFFENEAELTESDWDSADEDEKDLDVLDAEQGDGDIFDEDQMKVDLERIHMYGDKICVIIN